MRFGWLAEAPTPALAAELEGLGYDMIWIDEGNGGSATAAAAGLAPATQGLRVGVTVELGGVHPIEVAEELAVADLCLGGRLVVAARPAAGVEEARFAEALDLLLECGGAHPFRHAGPAWPTPAGLEQNVWNVEQRVRVGPAPAQLELPVWVDGAAGRPAAVERGLGVVFEADTPTTSMAAWFESSTAAHPHLWRRARRAARWSPPVAAGRLDLAAAVADLVARQRAAAIDVAIVCAPSGIDRRSVMAAVAADVRPRVQLDRLPPGLDDHWSAEQPSQPDPRGGHHA
jgi:hypothetical protein